MTTTPTTPAPLPVQTTPAWWLHWLNLAISLAAFVGVVIHPGWHPPALLVDVVGPVAVLAAVVSSIVFGILDHKGKRLSLSQSADVTSRYYSSLTSAAVQLATAVGQGVPSLEPRIAAVEGQIGRLTPLLRFAEPAQTPQALAGAPANSQTADSTSGASAGLSGAPGAPRSVL